jgi:hypothetical protein
MLNSGQIDYVQFRVLAVYSLLGLKWNRKTYSTPDFIPTNELPKWENIFRLSEFIDNFFEKKTDENSNEIFSVKQHFIHNHSPFYRLFKKYYGPESAFENVLFGQYLDGLEEFIYYSQTGSVQALRNLFAIFYLSKNEKYNRKNSLKRAKNIFKYVDIRHLYGFYVFFSSMQNYIMSGNVVIMGQEIDLQIIFAEVEKENIKSTIPSIGWVSTAQDIAESGVFGTYENVRNTEMRAVLLRLYELKKRAFDDKAKETADKSKK